jgi:mRNA interferase RelE/StbE
LLWKIEFNPTAQKQFKRLDGSIQRQIFKYLAKVEKDPLSCGYWLEENLSGFRKYRIGAWRVVADIQRDKVIVQVVKVGHRSEVYD